MKRAFKNIAVKWENAGNLHFLPFQQFFSILIESAITFTKFKKSAISFHLDKSKHLLFEGEFN